MSRLHGTWQATGGSGGGGGGLVLIVIAAAALIGSGAASALVTIAIVLAAVTGLAVATVAGVLIWRVRQERPGAPTGARQVSQIPPETRPALEVPHKTATPEIGNAIADLRAIEPPQLHLHFHGMSPAEVAEAIRQAGQG